MKQVVAIIALFVIVTTALAQQATVVNLWPNAEREPRHEERPLARFTLLQNVLRAVR